MVNVLNKQVTELTGETSYTTDRLENYPLYALTIYGKSVQNGTPTPEVPVDIVSVGDDGAVEVVSCGKNLFNPSLIKTETKNGVTCTNNGDGTFSFSGTPTKAGYGFGKAFTHLQSIGIVSTGFYSISGVPIDLGVYAYVNITYNGITHYLLSTTKGKTTAEITADMLRYEDFSISIGFWIKTTDATDIDGKTYYIQFEKNNTATSYEPYRSTTATITSGLPLCSIGNVYDELIYNADGTGKIIKRTKLLELDGSEDEKWTTSSSETRIQISVDMSVTVNQNEIAECMCNRLPVVTAVQTWNGVQGISLQGYPTYTALHICISSLLDNYDLTVWRNWLAQNPLTVIYQLAEPQEIELSAAEMAKLQQLETLNGVCNIYNSGNGEMYIRAMTAGFEYGHEVGFFDSKI